MAAQVLPLPPGWEAKYDPGQKRYFFINHNTHETTWKDPRLQQPTQLNQPSWQESSPYLGRGQSRSPRQSTENIAMQDLNMPKWQKDIENKYNIKVSTMGTDESEGETEAEHTPAGHHQATGGVQDDKVSKLKKLFPTAEDWAIRNTLYQCEHDEAKAITSLENSGYQKQSAQSQLRENNLVNKLKKEFPTAEDGVIRDLIQCVEQNESRAKQELKALGYKHNSLHDVAPKQPSPMKKTSTTSLSNRVSPAKSSTSTTQSEPSETEKERIKKKISREFPSYTAATLNIILNTTKYNEDKARKLLESMSKQEPTNRKPSKERTMSPERLRPSETSSASYSNSSTAFTMPDFKIPTVTFSSSTAKVKSSTTVSSSQRRQAQPKSTTKKKHKVGHHSSREGHPVRNQYISANRLIPRGPDPNLAQGPDLDLLIDDYALINGPNPEICYGPNQKLVDGSKYAVGPDPVLTSGADPCLCCGADPDLLEHRFSTRGPPLVTAL